MAHHLTWRERAVHGVARLLGVHVSTRPCWCDIKYSMHPPAEPPRFVAYEELAHKPNFSNGGGPAQFSNGDLLHAANRPSNASAEALLKQNLEVYQKGIQNG